MTKRYLPSDVSSDIHQIIAKALHARLAAIPGRHLAMGVAAPDLVLTRTELEAAAEAEFEYDVHDDGSILFRPARD